jgi:hypothetical protein
MASSAGANASAAPCVGAALMGKRVKLHSLNSIVYNDMLASVVGWEHKSARSLFVLIYIPECCRWPCLINI